MMGIHFIVVPVPVSFLTHCRWRIPRDFCPIARSLGFSLKLRLLNYFLLFIFVAGLWLGSWAQLYVLTRPDLGLSLLPIPVLWHRVGRLCQTYVEHGAWSL
jgi:hypothetical protein